MQTLFKKIVGVVFACIGVCTHQITYSENLEKEQMCMARNMYFESRGETDSGNLAVAQVTLNRVKHPNYPNSVCGVVYQRNRRGCQFSWTCAKNMIIKDKRLWERSKRLAKVALTNGVAHPKLKKSNALYYHHKAINPRWNRRHIVHREGVHIFYRKVE